MNTVWHDYSRVHTQNGTVVAIGNFDGLHKGHIRLMKMLSRVAREYKLPSVVYTFDKHPINVLKGDNTLKLIADNEQKQALLSSCDIDTLFYEDFNVVKDLEAEDFVRDILVEKLNMKIAVVGYHNHYGKESKGDVKLLRELGQKYGFQVYMIEPLYFDNLLCSSSKIRKLIEDGNIAKANELLGRPFQISNIIVQDKMLGRTLGFPTANMIPNESVLLPKDGVYATTVTIGDKEYKSMTSIGTNPTIGEESERIETHIIGFDGDLYDKSLTIKFIERIRDNVEFGSLDELQQQLEDDKKLRIG